LPDQIHSAVMSDSAAAAPASHFEQCMAAGQAYKAAGNAAFQAGDLQRALGQYARVVGCVGGLEVPAAFTGPGEIGLLAQGLKRPPPLTEAQLRDLHALVDSTTLNRAACHAKPGPLQSWQKVYELSSQVLERDPRNAKALFRRGQAVLQHGGAGAAETALTDLTAAAAILPTDAGIAQLLAQAKRQIAQQQQEDERKLRAQFAGMFK